ncbi:hypothetical protein N7520_006551 [Penicillium odoratum]|uniref:uncharacterized protein n=1 Tax=Penicillium odoratum TaxID=1167516 RepID=UPI0025498EB6|nr:uncharacterized protein N7520_006551 [Penicillium odoratum]KAJ5759395.1 hypothetical protein N7520_006551 [Penicillium odoratum]
MVFQHLSIHFRLPPLELFSWQLGNAPAAFPPPSIQSTWLQPFAISDSTFQAALSPRVPITTASIYLIAVTTLNRVNQQRHNVAWKIARTSTFKWLVLFHNLLLTLFSAWTLYGVCCSIATSLPSNTEFKFSAQVADALCRITSDDHPHGINLPHVETLSVDSEFFHRPSSSRLWSQGYAYFGWLFYLSKLYEVVDTFIILMKGKRSSMLQMYHHTGVILCVWAAVRFISPAGIIPMVLNAGVHTMMYTYFVWTSLDLPVSKFVKQTLTTLQISQFLFVWLFGWAYMFVEFDTPVQRSTHHDGIIPYEHHQVERTKCLQNNHQAFTVWLTALYLVPLIYLFVSFFNRSYLRKAKVHTK